MTESSMSSNRYHCSDVPRLHKEAAFVGSESVDRSCQLMSVQATIETTTRLGKSPLTSSSPDMKYDLGRERAASPLGPRVGSRRRCHHSATSERAFQRSWRTSIDSSSRRSRHVTVRRRRLRRRREVRVT